MGLLRSATFFKVLKRERQSTISDSFDKEAFFRPLSYRDFLTPFTLAISLLAFYQVMQYYLNEHWIADHWVSIAIVAFLVAPLLNHAIYKLEHRRSNNFVGRVLHDLIFFLIFFILFNVRTYILFGSIRQPDEGLPAVFGVVIVAFIFEILVAILKRLLRLFKWQVL